MSEAIRRDLREMLAYLQDRAPSPKPVKLRVIKREAARSWGITYAQPRRFEIVLFLEGSCAKCKQLTCAHAAIAQETLLHEYAHVLSYREPRLLTDYDLEWGLWYAKLYYLWRGPH